MDKIWEYTRRAMEECYISRADNFICPKEWSENTACTCIPIVAMNYVACLSNCCYEGLDIITEWKWNPQNEVYMPTVHWNQLVLGYNLRTERLKKSISDDDLCTRTEDEMQYLMIRSKETQTIINKAGAKEELLYGKIARKAYSSNYFSLYWYCAYALRLENQKKEYINTMFKFFFFLFPCYMLGVLENDLDNMLKQEENDDVANTYYQYHRDFINQYFMCCDKIKKGKNWAQYVNILKEYSGIDLNLVQEGFASTRINRGISGGKTLKCIMNNQIVFFCNVKLRMKNYVEQVIRLGEKMNGSSEDIQNLRVLREKCRMPAELE